MVNRFSFKLILQLLLNCKNKRDLYLQCQFLLVSLMSRATCAIPGCTRPRYVENGYEHPYCGRTCANKANAPRSSSSNTNAILFYNRGEPYYEFTNFYEPPHGILIDGYLWKTTEIYFQAMKFIDHKHHLSNMVAMNSSRDAFSYAQQNRNDVRSDWFKVSKDVMYKAVSAKFIQYPTLAELLLGTNSLEIIEHTSNDSFWGDGGDGTGENNLGKILMRVRRDLKNSTFPPRMTIPKL